MEQIEIYTETIQLDQLLKWAGVVDTGGQVKVLLEDGLIFVNGAVVTERRKKICHGDVVEIQGAGKWKVVSNQG